MIRVTEYESLGKGKLRIRLDNRAELVLYRGEARRVGLEPEVEIAEETYQLLIDEIVGKRAKKRALYLLEQMDRTEHQLREKLAKGGYPQECIDAAIAYVKRFHYLDDYRYACNFIRYSQGKYSRQQMKIRLAQKGIARELVANAIEETYTADESEQIQSLLLKRKFSAECDDKEFKRTYQYLMRRGFGSSEVLHMMKNYGCEAPES